MESQKYIIESIICDVSVEFAPTTGRIHHLRPFCHYGLNHVLFNYSCVMLLAFFLAGGAYAEETPKKDPPKKDEPVKEAGRKTPDSKDPKDMTLDECEAASVCPVTRNPSKLIYHVKAGEKEYHFATREASKLFQADPAKYGYKENGDKAK